MERVRPSIEYIRNLSEDTEKTKIKHLGSTIFISTVLLFATFVAWPDQLAYAHDSAWHDFCWDQTLNAFDFLPELVPAIFVALRILATLVAAVLGFFLSFACSPQTVAPPDRAIMLECNTILNIDGRRIGGYLGTGNKIDGERNSGQIEPGTGKVTQTKTGMPTVGQFVVNTFSDVTDDEIDDRVGFAVIHFVSLFVPLLLILGPIVLKAIPGAGVLAEFVVGAIAGFFDYKFIMNQHAPNDGHATHPAIGVNEVTVNKEPDSFYPLGSNTIVFRGKTPIGTTDDAPYNFNVVDIQEPQLDFEQNPVILEANAHFGFKVDASSINEMGQIFGIDECDPSPIVEYKGDSFYPLTIIEGAQNATWKVTEHDYQKWEDPPELNEILAGVTEQDITQAAPLGTTFSTAKAFEAYVQKKFFKDLKILNQEINDLEKTKRALRFIDTSESLEDINAKILKQQQKVAKAEELLTIGEGLRERIPNSEVDIDSLKRSVAREKAELARFEKQSEFTKLKVETELKLETKKVSFAKKAAKLEAIGKISGAALGAIGAAISEATKKPPKIVTETGDINTRNQSVIVQDTIPPDILVLNNLAVEVEESGPVELEILPPLVFDVADPLPTLFHNASGIFEELEGGTLKATFPIGLTKIGWNATDFSKNNSTLVFQLINIKKAGTNLNSAALNHTVPMAYSDIPIDIELNATNPDGDPLEFFIAQNPDDGVILSPIDPIFQNRFQLKGTVSTLKGITVDSDEKIFLTDSENQRVLSLDSMGDLDIAFDTSLVSLRPEGIDRIDSDTYLLSDWEQNIIGQAEIVSGTALPEKAFETNGLFEEPKNLAFNSGKIYVTDLANGTITKIVNTDAFLFPLNFSNPKSIAVSDDRLFLTDSGNNRIISFNGSSFDFQTGSLGNATGKFDQPTGLATNGTNILVADSANHRIQILNNTGMFEDSIGTGTAGDTNAEFDMPSGVTTNATHIFVADTGNHRIQIFNSQETYVQTLGTGTAGDTNAEFDMPSGVTTNATHIFVADTGNHRIQVFNSTGGFVSTIGSGFAGVGDGELNKPNDITTNGTHVFIADTNNDRIQIFNSTGNFVTKFGSFGTEIGRFNAPTGIDVDSNNNLYVVDMGNSRIQIFDSKANHLKSIHSKISFGLEDQIDIIRLSFPDLQADALDFDAAGNVVLADWNKNQLVKLTRGGSHIPVINLANIGLTDPKNIAINGTNNILLTNNQTSSIVVLFENGTKKGTVDLSGIVSEPTGISVDSSNNIIVIDSKNEDEKLVTLDADGMQIGPPFSLETIFENPRDVATNGTFFWITDDLDDKKKIVQIRTDRGKVDEFDLGSAGSSRLGLTFSKSGQNTILYTNSTDGLIYSIDTTTGDITIIKDHSATNVLQGISSSPMIPRFLGPFVKNGTGGLLFPTGMTYGPDGNLYISNTGDNSIKKFNATTGQFINNFVGPGEGDLDYPRDLIFGIDGNLYVTSFDTDSVIRFNGTTGEFLDDFVTSNSGPLDGPTGLTFDLAGHLLVSNSINNNIMRFNGTSGEFIDFFVPNIGNGGLVAPQSISYGPDLNLYVTSSGTNEILRFDGMDGTFIGNFTKGVTLSNPNGIAFDVVNDLLYVTSHNETSDEVLQFNATTGQFLTVHTGGELLRPIGLLADPLGNLLVSSYSESEVLQYGIFPVNLFVSDWSGPFKVIGLDDLGEKIFGFEFDLMGLSSPRNIATDTLGNIWVADVDSGKGRLVNFDGATGQKIKTIPLVDIPTLNEEELVILEVNEMGEMVSIDEEGNVEEFEGIPTISIIPEGLAIDSMDNFYVSDWNNNRIIKLTFDGDFVEEFKTNGTVSSPKDLIVTEGEKFVNLFVTDGNTGKVLKLRSDRLIKEFDITNQVDEINGLVFKDKSLFLTSTESGKNGKIFEFAFSEQLNPVTDVFVEPEGIAVINPDEIFVTDWKDERILKLDKGGVRTNFYNLTFANFLVPDRLRDIDIKEQVGFTNFWVADSRKAEVPKLRVNSENAIEKQPSVADKFVFMSSLSVDREDNFYVTSTQNSTFVKFTERGSLLNNVTIPETRRLVDVSTGINASDGSILVFLGMGNPPELQIFNSTLDFKNGTISVPSLTSVVSQSNGTILASHTNDKITRFSDKLVIGPPLQIPGGGNSISDMVVDHNDNLFAADSALHRIHKFNLSSGDYLGWLGKCDSGSDCDLNDNHTKGFVLNATNLGQNNGAGFSQFFEPSAVTVDRTGNIFVADIQQEEKMNAPRIQKFSNSGFFIENFLSNTTNTRIKGNFNNTQAIAVGSNFFYVADIEKLHFFDINPFSPISIEQITNITSSDVTYQANLEFPKQLPPPAPPVPFDFDQFKFKVSDGFDESNVALVNITVNNPDLDRDEIFFNVDTDSNAPSTIFEDSNENRTTFGQILDEGDQVLTIRDDRDPERGVFIQADVTPKSQVNPKPATIRACNSVDFELNPGNRLTVTCGSATVDVIRGNIKMVFFDEDGRNGIVRLGVDDSISFSPFNFAFSAPQNNSDDEDVIVSFNGKEKTYTVSPGKEIRVDKAPPRIDQTTCSDPLVLEAEIIAGVNATNSGVTNHFVDVTRFLSLLVQDEDNGFPQMTQGKNLPTTHNATNGTVTVFPVGETNVRFTAIDDVGNMASCISTVTIEDTTKPVIVPDQDKITVNITEHDDVAYVSFDTGTTFDLPVKINDPANDLGRVLSDEMHVPKCVLSPGSSFVLGDNAVGCVGTDKEGNVGQANFTITVMDKNVKVGIESIFASDEKSPTGLSDGDKIFVIFTQATNQPPANTKSEIDSLFNFTQNDNSTAVVLGEDYGGAYLSPSVLVITILDSKGATTLEGDTRFVIKPTSGLKSASGQLDLSTEPSQNLLGSFSEKSPPFILAFVADDPVMGKFDEGDDIKDDIEISPKDILVLRFSEPTNTPGGFAILKKDKVDELFEFTSSAGVEILPGNDYEGQWVNPSTFEITVKEMNTMVSKDPLLGDTIAIVKPEGNLKTKDNKSGASSSQSMPLSGSFAPFSIQKSLKANGTATVNLPSGLNVGITLPEEDKVTIARTNAEQPGKFGFLGHAVEIKAGDDNACDAGCTLFFTFTNDDLRSARTSLASVKILHDVDDDGIFEKEEELVPEILELSPTGPYTATVEIFNLSVLAIGGDVLGGGGGGDETPPEFRSLDYISCDPEIGCGAQQVSPIEFVNEMATAKVPVGEPQKFILRLHENSGPEALEHVTLYMNFNGFLQSISDSDTFIRFDKGKPTLVKDPHGFISDASISVMPREQNLDVIFDITFAKTMEKSDVIIRAWDIHRNSKDVRFNNAIEVLEKPKEEAVQEGGKVEGIQDSVSEPPSTSTQEHVPQQLLDGWLGFSEKIVSDEEILDYLGYEGDLLPSWYKPNISKWLKDGVITQEELLDAISFFDREGLIR